MPHSAFPEEKKPEEGYWIGKTCKTSKGGQNDIGIRIDGEDIFTRLISEVAGWLLCVSAFHLDSRGELCY